MNIYLEVGNMEDILNMDHNDFMSLINQMIYKSKPLQTRVKKISKRQIEMIRRANELDKR